MIEFLLMLIAAPVNWLADSVVTPVVTTLHDYPWLSGLVLFAVLAVIVGDTMRTERAQERREEATQR